MNWLDVLIILPILVGLVRGLMRGFISEIIAFVVVILGVLGARLIAPPFSGALLSLFDWPNPVCDVVAYTVVFLMIAVGLSIAAKLLNKFLKAIHLGWANRAAGGLIGMLKYGLLVMVVVFVMDRTNDSFHYLDDAEVVQTSFFYPKFVQLTDALLSFSRSELGGS